MVFEVDDNSRNKRDALACARLIVSRRLDLPIVIGVFGRRETAKKSFVDTLSRMVDNMAKRPPPGKVDDYVSSVLTVDYDAWQGAHITPTIGIAERIFGSLHELYRDKPDHDYYSYQLTSGDGYLDEIKSIGRLRRDASNKLKVAEEIVEHNRRVVRSAEEAYQTALQEYAEASAYIKWEDANISFHQKCNPESLENIKRAGRVLGLQNLENDPDALNRILDEAKTIGGQASLLTSVKIAKRYFGTVLLLVLALALLLASVYITILLAGKIGSTKDLIDSLVKVAGGISAAIGFIGVIAIAVAQNRASRAILHLQAHEPLFRKTINELDQRTLLRLSIAKETLDTRRNELGETKARLADAERDLSLANEQRYRLGRNSEIFILLLQYYRDRQSLGEDVSSIIREDFASMQLGIGFGTRIILYISGLDNCGQRGVAEIIKTIRFLLLTPPFIVVLKADLAWITDSLASIYASDIVRVSNGALPQLIDIPYWPNETRYEATTVIERLLWDTGVFKEFERAPTILPGSAVVNQSEASDLPTLDEGEIRVQFDAEARFIEELTRRVEWGSRSLKGLIIVYAIIRSTVELEEIRACIEKFETHMPVYEALLVHLFFTLGPSNIAWHYFQALSQCKELDVFIQSLRTHEDISYQELDVLALCRNRGVSIELLTFWRERAQGYGWLDSYALDGQSIF